MVHSPKSMMKSMVCDDDGERLQPGECSTHVVLMPSNANNGKIKKNFRFGGAKSRSSKNFATFLLFMGAFFAISAIVTHFYLHSFLEKAVLQEFILHPESTSFAGWKKTNIPIYSYYYLFNITNAEQLFQEGGAKPILQEVGPFVFQQSFEKINISWNLDNSTVEYRQIKRWIPVPELTNGSLDDEIVHINVPLMTGIHQVKLIPEEEKFLAYESLNSMIDAFQLPLFMRHKVSDLLFDGYEDDLLKTAASFYPSDVTSSKFGWLFEKNNTSTDGLFRIHTGQLDFGKKLGLLDTWNRENVITKWNKGEKCRSLNQTTTGDLQPPFFLQQNYPLLKYFQPEKPAKTQDTIRMFIADMCRTFDLEYVDEIVSKNLPGYRYHMGPTTFNYSFEENRCYCNTSCPPDGLFDFGVCAQDAPLYVSSPHFLYGDPYLLESVSGLKPDIDQHQFFMDFDKNFGIAINVDVKFQLNIFATKTKDIEIMADWPDDLHIFLPQFWFITRTSVDDTIASQLYFISEILPLVLFLMTLFLGVMSIICIIYLVCNGCTKKTILMTN